ncbi:MAG TPA: ATP-binding cassette domain-containing protein [Clostridiaceae bacterium]|nr:ATP-binding cassette domain-containing protein [Clostridiaceae bacterium]
MQLQFENINKYFGDFHVLKDVSFTVRSGQIFGFLGRNGAGKTTAIRILMDVFKSDQGKILLDGREFSRTDHVIGYLPEERGMYSKTTVKDQLVYFAMLRGAKRQDALESVLYWTKRFEIDEYLERKLETLSKGNQQKVQITQAFLNEPSILILDEPFSGLDPLNAQLFQEALTDYISEDRIIIFSSHQMSYVETFCDDIAIIDRGEIILAGTLEDIKEKESRGYYHIGVTGGELDPLLADLAIPFSKEDSHYLLELGKEEAVGRLLQAVMESRLKLQLFAPYRPSLHEIFISKVGEANE